MRSSPNNPRPKSKKISVERPSKAAQSKPLATKPNRPQSLKRSRSKETSGQLKLRAATIVAILKETYPEAKCSLDARNPFELLIATILSAQCTDKRVNMVTPALFKDFPTPREMASADPSKIEELIRSTGFYKNKAKNILRCSQEIIKKHNGTVPASMEELSSLAGVGRKTANVVLGNAFGIPGMVVDTHVTRISNLLGLAKGDDAVKLEHQLREVIVEKDWIIFSHLLIDHGRHICIARRPQCGSCALLKLCPRLGL